MEYEVYSNTKLAVLKEKTKKLYFNNRNNTKKAHIFDPLTHTKEPHAEMFSLTAQH